MVPGVWCRALRKLLLTRLGLKLRIHPLGAALALAAALEATGRAVRVLSYPDPPVTLVDLPELDGLALPSEVAAESTA